MKPNRKFLLCLATAFLAAIPQSLRAYDCGNEENNVPPCTSSCSCSTAGAPGGNNPVGTAGAPNPAGNPRAVPASGLVGANPINPHRASLNRDVTDIRIFGPAGFTFTRHYNSRNRDYTDARWELGAKNTWQHNWQYEVRESNQTDFGFPKLIVRYPEGREYYFSAVDSSGSIRVPAEQWGDRLYPDGTNFYVLRTPEGAEFRFEKVSIGGTYQYLLRTVKDGMGPTLTLTYQTKSDTRWHLYRVTNNYGRYLQLSGTYTGGSWRITSVAANDGRTVNFGYATYTPTNESVLESVTYPDSTSAAYTWVGSDSATPSNTGRPVLASASDPMYGGAGAMAKYVYNYNVLSSSPFGLVNGTILEERNLVTDQLIVSLPLGSGSSPQILEGNGIEVGRHYTVGLMDEISDGEGRTTQFVRTAGKISQVIENDGATTTYTRDAIGRVLTCVNALSGTSSFTYNAAGFLLTSTDEEGRTTTHTRNSSNRVTRTDYPDGSYETWGYTGSGLVSSHRFRNGSTESFTYNSWGLLVTHTDAAGKVTTFTYDNKGLIASRTDARSNTTSYEYNWRGQQTKVTHPGGSFRTMVYDAFGNQTSMTDELSHTWTRTYNEYNQLATETDPLNRTTTYEYGQEAGCGCGYLQTIAKITTPSGKVTSYQYDDSGKKIAVDTGGAVTQFTYNSAGLVHTVVDPLNHVTTYQYDLLRRKISETDSLTRTTSWTYDKVGNTLTETRPDNGVTINVYDVVNRLVSTTNPKNETTTFDYGGTAYNNGTKGDNLTRMTDARSNSYTFTYDVINRKTKMIYPGGGSDYEQWTYDNVGNMATYRTRAGQVMTCTHDNRNRDTLCDWSDSTPDITKTYDNAGRLLGLTSTVSTLNYTYDNANQLISERQQIAGLSSTVGQNLVAPEVVYGYNTDGLRSYRWAPDFMELYMDYDSSNRLVYMEFGDPFVGWNTDPFASFAYDLKGRRTTRWTRNAKEAVYTYDNGNQLTNLYYRDTSNNTLLLNLDYTHNSVGNRTSRTETVSGTSRQDTYGYDAVAQVEQAKYHVVAGNPARQVDYTWDAVGNRSQTIDLSGTASVTTPYTANALNQYTGVDGLAIPTYDTNGNLTGFNGATYSYDAQNRLVAVTTGTNTANFAYDGRNRLVKQTINGVTRYRLYDGWQLMQEIAASGTVLYKYVDGPGGVDEHLLQIDCQTFANSSYPMQDGLGNVVALVVKQQVGPYDWVIAERYRYDVFGKPTITDGGGNVLANSAYPHSRYQFTGREYHAELGLHDYRNRFYHPDLGRFLQTDPIRFKDDPVHLYRYIANNSVNKSDPMGLGAAAIAGGAGCALADGPLPFGDIILIAAIADTLWDCLCKAEIPRCEKVGERGRDGSLPHGSVMCIYDCNGQQGSITVGAGEKCPENPKESEVDGIGDI